MTRDYTHLPTRFDERYPDGKTSHCPNPSNYDENESNKQQSRSPNTQEDSINSENDEQKAKRAPNPTEAMMKFWELLGSEKHNRAFQSILAVLIFLTTGYIACVYNGQLSQMIEQNGLTRKVLELQYSQSRSLVQITTTNFYKETAADIRKAGMLTIEIQNSGKATASKVHGMVMVQFLPASQQPDLDAIGYITKFTNPPLFSGAQPSGVPVILIYKYGTIAQVPQDVWLGLDHGTWYVAVFGRVEYADSFGEWWTQFCAYRPFFKTETTPHILGFSASKCVDYNIDGGTPKKP